MNILAEGLKGSLCALYTWVLQHILTMVKFNPGLLVAWTWSTGAYAFVDYGNVYPAKYSLGETIKVGDLDYDNTTSITLSPMHPIVTLDYGTEVAGFPFFVTSDSDAPAQIEVKYSESFVSILKDIADGPWTFSNGLSNTWRVETFNITSAGYTESFFVQGGQRWQTLRLLTNHSLTLESAGFRSTSEHAEVNELPGYMETDNDVYNKVFDLGGRNIQVACIDAGNAPSTWEVTRDGAFIRGQASAQSSDGVLLKPANYTMEFNTKIVRGGTGWRVAASAQPKGPYFVLTSNYPEENTFSNTNRTLLPPNTLIFNGGWNLVNQTTLETPANVYYPLDISVEEGKWYRISTTIKEDGYSVRLDGKELALVPLYTPTPSNPLSTVSGPAIAGSWGFGGFQDQIAVVSNVSVKASNGTVVYKNGMRSEDILAEYAVAPLDHSVCLDGAKRDRLVWIGDFYHTVRVLAQSSARWDYILGSIGYIFSFPSPTGPLAGLVQKSPRLGTRPEYGAVDPASAGLIDYQDLFLTSIGEYYRYTGDAQGLKPYWDDIKALVKARLAFIDPYSGLVANSAEVPFTYSFLGPANGTYVTAILAYALNHVAPIALALEDTETASLCSDTATKLLAAINDRLWNPELGTYSLSVDSPGNYSITSIAWSILSGAANGTQASSSIAKLADLRYGPGYKSYNYDAESDDYQLAPNPSGFLLEALFQAHHEYGSDSEDAISHLLEGLWGAMVNDDLYYSGAAWEYVKPDGSPGLNDYTSLAHPWGAAPTYVLPEYLLGVAPTTPGYGSFVVRPAIGYLGLDKVGGRVPTPLGAIKVSWKVSGSEAKVSVEVPGGAKGEMKVPKGWTVAGGESADDVLELSSGHTQVVLYAL